jgi:hypothetical protein
MPKGCSEGAFRIIQFAGEAVILSPWQFALGNKDRQRQQRY